MTPVLRQVRLPDSPEAVGMARHWVNDALNEVGRGDLADSAEVAISELVTNALIHGSPPVSVRMVETSDVPRVEVVDHSPRAPLPDVMALRVATDQGPMEVSAIGRGLAIVGMHSSAWGALPPDGSGAKIVWFEPRAEPDMPADLFDLEGLLDEVSTEESATTTVELRSVPTREILRLDRHLRELGRELRLIVIAHPERDIERDLETVISDYAAAADSSPLRPALREALKDAEPVFDTDIPCTPSLLALVHRFNFLVTNMRELLASHTLLVQPLTDYLERLQEWFLGEFIRQGEGGPPTAAPAPA